MSEKFNPKNHIDKFLKKRDNYLKKVKMKDLFYTEKYNFHFHASLSTKNQQDNRQNCTYIPINSYEEYQSIFSELELFSKKSTTEVLRSNYFKFELENKLPFYLILCVQHFPI
jgi:hypothetical protein